MRTTVTLDEDVAAFIEVERQRTGESFRQVLNRLLRRAAHNQSPDRPLLSLPILPGRPRRDLTDVSAVLAELDESGNELSGA